MDQRSGTSGVMPAWAPLRRSLFRNRLVASVISNTGGWMQDTAGTWLMTALTSSPLLIALMRTAATLPVLFFGVPAGAMADIFDRRRLLLLLGMVAAGKKLNLPRFASFACAPTSSEIAFPDARGEYYEFRNLASIFVCLL